MDAIGHYGSISRLVHFTASLIGRSSRSMDAIAAHLLLIASDFEAVEAVIAAEMMTLVDALGDPTPRTDVEYGYDERV